MEPEKAPNRQGTVEKENKAGGIAMQDFELYYKAVIQSQHGTGTKTNT